MNSRNSLAILPMIFALEKVFLNIEFVFVSCNLHLDTKSSIMIYNLFRILSLQVIPAARTRVEKVAPVARLARLLSAIVHLGVVVKHVKDCVLLELAPLDRLAKLAQLSRLAKLAPLDGLAELALLDRLAELGLLD